MSKIKCFRCNQMGHLATNCPEKDKVNEMFVGCIEEDWAFVGMALSIQEAEAQQDEFCEFSCSKCSTEIFSKIQVPQTRRTPQLL